MKLTPAEAMAVALEEARKGSGFVSPNPLVGCVILDRDFQFLSKGYHAKIGGLHAETHALANVEDRAKLEGAHVYVTLEPCAHVGRQPSCAVTLAALPIASVTYGLQDPNPRVAGQGAEILRAAGKTVTLFTELQVELEELAEIFLTNMRAKRPFVSLKVASSLDGQVALKDGSSKWITGEFARGHVQSLRGFHDAILTGAGTFIRDNPKLNSRDSRFQNKILPLVLLDPAGSCVRHLAGSEVLSVRKPEHLFLVTQPGVPVIEGVRHIELPLREGEFDLHELLLKLQEHGIYSLFVEAGAQTISSFLRQKVGDRLFVFLAPKILGLGLSWSSGLEISSLERAVRLENMRCEVFGQDVLLTGKVHFP